MRKVAKYCVFGTNWGYFGLAGTAEELCVTQLPGPDASEIRSRLLRGLAGLGHSSDSLAWQSPGDCEAKSDSGYFKVLQERIVAYFAGERVAFDSEIPLNIACMSDFGRAVLSACRQVEFGHTVTYSGLAGLAGRPRASRAVGAVMAANKMPLIIPCHRVLRSDGGLGGFSAPGGVVTKARLLAHEHACAGAPPVHQPSPSLVNVR